MSFKSYPIGCSNFTIFLLVRACFLIGNGHVEVKNCPNDGNDEEEFDEQEGSVPLWRWLFRSRWICVISLGLNWEIFPLKCVFKKSEGKKIVLDHQIN